MERPLQSWHSPRMADGVLKRLEARAKLGAATLVELEKRGFDVHGKSLADIEKQVKSAERKKRSKPSA